MNKRDRKLIEIAEEEVNTLNKKKKGEDEFVEYAVTPYGLKYKMKGRKVHTYILLSHNKEDFRL